MSFQVHKWKIEGHTNPQLYTLIYSRDEEGIQTIGIMLSMKEWRILHEEIGTFIWSMEWMQWEKKDE